MEYMQIEKARLSRCLGQLASAYPSLYGKAQPSRIAYEVLRETGNGSWSRVLYTHDRKRAENVFATLPKKGRWITCQNVLTGEILGSVGRAPRNISRLIQNVLNDLQEPRSSNTAWVPEQRFIAGRERTVHLQKDRRAILYAQLRVFVGMTRLPDVSELAEIE